MSTASLPISSAELTADFLTAALREAGVLGGGRVTGFERSSVGDAGQTGEVVRLSLRYGDGAPADAPRTLIAKHAAPFEQARVQMHALGLYEREVRFYQDFGGDAGISTPRCYFAQIDPATGNFALLLEDVGQGRSGDFWKGSVEDAEVAITNLAAFHARWWGHPRLRSTSWLRQPDDVAYYRDALGPLLPAFTPVVQARFPGALDGYLLRVVERLTERWDAFVMPRPEDVYTLAHVDYHPKQMFFPHEGRGRFAVFDWQGVCVSVGAMDLQRALITMLDVEQLAAHEQRLIELYHRVLAEHGVRHPLEQLVDETWRAASWTLWIAIFALATTDVEILRRDAEANGADLQQRVFGDLAVALERNRTLERLSK